MKNRVLSAALLIFSVAGSSFALDKADFEIKFRKNMNLSTRKKIVVGETSPAPFLGLKEVPITVDGRELKVYLSQDEKNFYWGNVYEKDKYALFISTDDKKFLMGTIYDMAKDPDAERWKKISLKNVKSTGSRKAPVTLVEYSDLQCPYCSKGHEFVDKELPKIFPSDKLRIVFKHYPLDFHPWAEPAAIAAECAAAQNAFWPMADKFFTNAKDTTKENVAQKTADYVKELGLNKETFARCLTNPKTLEKIKAEEAEGESVGVSGTPAFVVNGRLIGGLSPDDIKAVIEEKLSEK